MNCSKELNLTQSKSKAHWWLKGMIWVLIVSFGIINFGCCEDCDCENEPSVPDKYYVKYDVNSSTIYIGGKLNVTFKTENNTNTTLIIDQRTLWETTIGPVQKGFTATMQVDAVGTTNNQLKLYTNISVSKNNEPFVLRKTDGSDTPRNSVQINYTIDY